MDLAPDARTTELRERLEAFVAERVLPAEARQAQQHASAADPWATSPVLQELKAEARSRGLWNLFLPPDGDGGGLTNVQYAPLAEVMGRSPSLAPEATNCSAPDTGNMEVLARFGTPEQQREWLDPLLAGEIRSAFLMTEPDVASSDATNVRCSIRREGGEYVVDGRKWWSSGAMNPACRVLVVLGVTDPDAPRHRRQSMVLVPRDAPGVTVVRPLTVFGYPDHAHGGHAEVALDGVRVPASNLLLGEGEGFRIAQDRLGPGRIHHCMRALGVAERALELMCRRVTDRVAFGRPLAEQGVVQEWVAESRIRIEMARLLVLRTAWLIDTVGVRGARTEVAAIKVAVPEAASYVVDRAIQAHGGAGVGQDTPLARMWAGLRTLHLADGPDEVHRMTVARQELRRYAPGGT